MAIFGLVLLMHSPYYSSIRGPCATLLPLPQILTYTQLLVQLVINRQEEDEHNEEEEDSFLREDRALLIFAKNFI